MGTPLTYLGSLALMFQCLSILLNFTSLISSDWIHCTIYLPGSYFEVIVYEAGIKNFTDVNQQSNDTNVDTKTTFKTDIHQPTSNASVHTINNSVESDLPVNQTHRHVQFHGPEKYVQLELYFIDWCNEWIKIIPECKTPGKL